MAAVLQLLASRPQCSISRHIVATFSHNEGELDSKTSSSSLRALTSPPSRGRLQKSNTGSDKRGRYLSFERKGKSNRDSEVYSVQSRGTLGGFWCPGKDEVDTTRIEVPGGSGRRMWELVEDENENVIEEGPSVGRTSSHANEERPREDWYVPEQKIRRYDSAPLFSPRFDGFNKSELHHTAFKDPSRNFIQQSSTIVSSRPAELQEHSDPLRLQAHSSTTLSVPQMMDLFRAETRAEEFPAEIKAGEAKPYETQIVELEATKEPERKEIPVQPRTPKPASPKVRRRTQPQPPPRISSLPHTSPELYNQALSRTSLETSTSIHTTPPPRSQSRPQSRPQPGPQSPSVQPLNLPYRPSFAISQSGLAVNGNAKTVRKIPRNHSLRKSASASASASVVTSISLPSTPTPRYTASTASYKPSYTAMTSPVKRRAAADWPAPLYIPTHISEQRRYNDQYNHSNNYSQAQDRHATHNHGHIHNQNQIHSPPIPPLTQTPNTASTPTPTTPPPTVQWRPQRQRQRQIDIVKHFQSQSQSRPHSSDEETDLKWEEITNEAELRECLKALEEKLGLRSWKEGEDVGMEREREREKGQVRVGVTMVDGVW